MADDVISRCGPGDEEALVIALRARGWAEREIYLYDESRASFNRAIQVARKHTLRSRLAEVLISRSSLNLEVGRSGAALRDVTAARTLLGSEPTIELDSQEALIAMKFGHHAQAVEIGLRARARIGPDTDPVNAAVVLINLGESLSYLGRVGEADAVFDEAAVVGAKVGHLFHGFAVQTHAAATVRAGRLAEGLAKFDLAEELMTAAGWPLGEHYLERIECFATLGLVDEADEAADRALDYFTSQGMGALMVAEVRLRQARMYLWSGRHDEAAGAAGDALRMFRRQRRLGFAAQSAVANVEARVRRGRGTMRDLRRAQDASSALREAGARGDEVDADLLVARLALRLGLETEARARLRRARETSTTGGSLIRARGSLATALEAQLDGDEGRLRIAARRGLAEVARFRASLPTTELRALASAHGVELAGLGLRSALRTGRVNQVLEWMERGRLASVLTDPPRPRDVALDEARVQLREVVSRQRAEAENADQMVQLQAEQVRLERRIQRRLRTIDPQASTTGNVVTATQVAERLTGSLVSLAAPDGRLVAATLGPVRRMVEVGHASRAIAEVDAVGFALRRLLRTRTETSAAAIRAGLVRSLEALDAQLVAPLDLPAEGDVVIVPTAELFAVPWHALPSLRDRRVCVAPSATVWLRALCREPVVGRVVAVAGPGLAAAEAEVRAVASVHGSAESVVPPDSTVTRVRELLDGARVAHVSCHGSFRRDNPSFSSLELSDGPLTVLDLESLDHAPETVVLASCDSGASRVLPGNELQGFLSALFMLGTQSVVASAVPVPDVETAALMVELHQGLAAGLAVGEALDSARATLDRETPQGLVMATAFAQYGAG